MDFIFSVLVLMVGAMALLSVQGRFERWERSYVWVSFLAHAVSAVVLVLLTQYFFGGGDLLAYHRRGAVMSELLTSDFSRYAPDMVRFVLRRPTLMKIDFAETSTGAMIGVSTWLHPLLGGSVYAKCMLIALCGVWAKYLMYKGIRLFFHRRVHHYILLSCLLLPSTVFWTSGLLKEPLAMLGMGPLTYGTALLIQNRRKLFALLLIMAGGFVVSLFKAYILFPWIIAMGVCFYWQRSSQTRGAFSPLKRMMYLVVFVIISFTGLSVLGTVFPKYSVSGATDEISNLQSLGQRRTNDGSSSYAVGGAPARSQGAQLALLPVGLMFALFRPLIFEARNGALLLNGLETSLFIYLFGRIIFITGPRQTFRTIMATPGLVGLVLFVIIFGGVVGIATTNVGTLSRYRIPMMPFYCSALLLLSALRLNIPKAPVSVPRPDVRARPQRLPPR